MEHLAWQLLETKQDVVAAERIFAQLANRARMASPTSSGGHSNAATVSAVQKMCAAVAAVHNMSQLSVIQQLSPAQCRDLAAAVCHPRFPNRVIFGMPETEEQLAKASHRILLCVHPDKGFVAKADACVKLSERKEQCLEEVRDLVAKRRERIVAQEQIRQFAESLAQHDITPLSSGDRPLDHNHPAASSSNIMTMMTSTSSSSSVRGQNMFAMNSDEVLGQMPYSASISNNNNDDNAHYSHSFVGAYHLPPLQARFVKTTRNTNNNKGGSQAARNGSASPNSRPRNSSSFASPVSRPLPPQVSAPSCGIPSPRREQQQQQLNSNNSGNTNAGGSGSNRASPVSSSNRSNRFNNNNSKQQSTAKQFDAMLSALREKAGTGVRLTSCVDYFEQQRALREQLERCEPQEREEQLEEHEMLRRVEDSMRALMEQLKQQNSHVQIAVNVKDCADDDPNHPTQLGDEEAGGGINSQGVFVSPAQKKEDSPGSCREFVVQKVNEVMRGHLKSFGDNVLDTDAIAAAVGEAGLASSKSGSNFASEFDSASKAVASSPQKQQHHQQYLHSPHAPPSSSLHASPRNSSNHTTAKQQQHQQQQQSPRFAPRMPQHQRDAPANLAVGSTHNLYRRK